MRCMGCMPATFSGSFAGARLAPIEPKSASGCIADDPNGVSVPGAAPPNIGSALWPPCPPCGCPCMLDPWNGGAGEKPRPGVGVGGIIASVALRLCCGCGIGACGAPCAAAWAAAAACAAATACCAAAWAAGDIINVAPDGGGSGVGGASLPPPPPPPCISPCGGFIAASRAAASSAEASSLDSALGGGGGMPAAGRPAAGLAAASRFFAAAFFAATACWSARV